MTDHILVTQDDQITRIQFNRPGKKNAITGGMYQTMAEAIKQADNNDDVRVIHISGTEGCFTSGNDIQDFLQNPPHSSKSPAFQFLNALSQTQKPVVAAVTGIAVGIGTTLLLHCDLVYAAASARFRLPFVNLGLVPEAGSSYILTQMMGHRRAAELLLLGDFFEATIAKEVGIVNHVYEDHTLADLVEHTLTQLVAQPPTALRLTKSLLKRQHQTLIQETMAFEGGQFRNQLQSPEALEALQAFMERRQPDFSQFT